MSAGVTAVVMLLGLAVVAPFILPEIRLLIHLGGQQSNR